MRATLIKSFEFHAGHALDTFPEGHKCRNIHGHTFRVDLHLAGEVDPATGYLMDFGEIKQHLAPIQDQLDHAYLNDIEDLPIATCEMLAKWLWDKLRPNLPLLTMIRIRETDHNAVEYRGE